MHFEPWHDFPEFFAYDQSLWISAQIQWIKVIARVNDWKTRLSSSKTFSEVVVMWNFCWLYIKISFEISSRKVFWRCPSSLSSRRCISLYDGTTAFTFRVPQDGTARTRTGTGTLEDVNFRKFPGRPRTRTARTSTSCGSLVGTNFWQEIFFQRFP